MAGNAPTNSGNAKSIINCPSEDCRLDQIRVHVRRTISNGAEPGQAMPPGAPT